MSYYIIILFFSLLICKPLYSQHYNFNKYSVEHGLSQSQISTLYEDSRGFLWIGTESHGISKYNGIDFKKYSQENGISTNQIRTIYEDIQGNIWFGLKGNFISKYNGSFFENYNNKDKYGHLTVNTIIEKEPGIFLIGTNDNGLIEFSNNDIKNLQLVKDQENIKINHLFKKSNKEIWIATNEHGIYIINEQDTIHISYSVLNNKTINSITADTLGNIWIAGQSEIYKYNGKFFERLKIPSNYKINHISTILFDRQGALWIGTYGKGIIKYNGKQFYIYNKKNGLSNDFINDIIEDRTGNIWIGTNGGGICKYEGELYKQLTEKDGLSNNMIRTIIEDKYNNLWFGTYGNGICRYNGKNYKYYSKADGLCSNIIYCSFEDNEGNLWFGSKDEGISKYNGKFFNYNKDIGIENHPVYSIFQDKNGNIWFGTYGKGLIIYDGNKFISITEKNGISSDYIYSIFEDDEENIWIGTESSGIDMIFADKIETEILSKHYIGRNSILNINQKYGLSNNQIIAILQDNNKNIWFGTFGEGLFKLDKDKNLKIYNTTDGLCSNNITFLLYDSKEFLWVGTDKGVNKLTIVDNKSIPQIQLYNNEYGFTSLETNINAAIEDNKGNIIIGTNKGVTIINCDEEIKNNITPKLFISNILLNSEKVNWKEYSDTLNSWTGLPEKLVLKHNQNNIIINFLGIDLKNPKMVRYKWILENFDKNWKDETNQNHVTYSFIPHGKYIFKLNSCNNDGVWNKIPQEISIEILPPFYLTYWFYIVIIILIIVIVLFTTILRSKKFEQEKKELEDKVEIRTKEINEQKITIEQHREKLKSQTEKLQLINKELQKLSIVARETDNSVIIADKDGNIEWVNEGFVKLFGYTFDEFKKEKGINILEFSYNENIEKLFKKCKKNKKSIVYSSLATTKLGKKIWVQTTLTPIFEENGNVEKYIAIDSNISDVKFLNEELKKLSLVASRTDNSVIIMNNKGIIEWINEGFNRMYDFEKNEVKILFGKSVFEIVNNKNKRIIERCIRLKMSDIYITNIKMKTGKLRWIQTVLTPILNGNQELEGLIAVESDISQIKKAEKQIQIEKEKSDILLLNILPDETAEELKLKGVATPRQYSKVSVLFTDFEGFSRTSENMTPSDLVNELHSYFVKFDEIVEKYYIEKIKTIGDAYMCVGGLPIRNKSHTFDTILTGLEIQRFIDKVNKIKTKHGQPKWELRIGIHTGAVVAGVVGKKKFAYDIWGDTVNIASRMEEACEIGKVNISGVTYGYVKDYFDFIYRGKIEAKNMGKIDMYFATNIKSEYSIDGKGIIPNEKFNLFLSEL